MSQITTQKLPINKKALSLFRRLWRAGDSSVLYSKPAVYYVRQRIREGFEEYKNETDERILDELFERCEYFFSFRFKKFPILWYINDDIKKYILSLLLLYYYYY